MLPAQGVIATLRIRRGQSQAAPDSPRCPCLTTGGMGLSPLVGPNPIQDGGHTRLEEVVHMAASAIADLPATVRRFRPKCPGCTPATVTQPGARPCSFYNCPGLPDELRVVCDICVYDFAAGDGQVKCDHRTCETALRLRGNVTTYRRWLRLLESETA